MLSEQGLYSLWPCTLKVTVPLVGIESHGAPTVPGTFDEPQQRAELKHSNAWGFSCCKMEKTHWKTIEKENRI